MMPEGLKSFSHPLRTTEDRQWTRSGLQVPQGKSGPKSPAGLATCYVSFWGIYPIFGGLLVVMIKIGCGKGAVDFPR